MMLTEMQLWRHQPLAGDLVLGVSATFRVSAPRMYDSEAGASGGEHAEDALRGVPVTAAGPAAGATPGAPAGTLGTGGALRTRSLSGRAPAYTATPTETETEH